MRRSAPLSTPLRYAALRRRRWRLFTRPLLLIVLPVLMSLLSLVFIICTVCLAGAAFAADVSAESKKTARDSTTERGSGNVQLHPLPLSIADNSTVTLQCGRHYFGTLNLKGRANVTVRTEGRCGKASISPAFPVKNWQPRGNNIWVAQLPFAPAQVSMDGRPLSIAHHPNKGWAKARASGPERLTARLPSDDLAGATLVYRPHDWMIDTRVIRDMEGGAMVLPPKDGEEFALRPETEFYVEGKLWMLDSPGEWAYQDGWLYVWPAAEPVSGSASESASKSSSSAAPEKRAAKSPEGRIWAAAMANGIDAADSFNVTIENIRIHTANIGINGASSTNLHVRRVDIVNSNQDGILAGGSGLLVDGAHIVNSRQNGILGYYGVTNSAVINSTIESTGTIGMPRRSRGGISFEQASGTRIHNNRVLDSAYIGIRVHRNAQVSNNLVDRACLVLSDCGGIYTFARDKLPSQVRIENNTVRNLSQRYGYGIYLDDSANGVTVKHNLLQNNPGGLEIHNGFNNLITENVFVDSAHEHILFNETGRESIRGNRIERNLFITGKGEITFRLWSGRGGETNSLFAQFDENIYAGNMDTFAELAGVGLVNWNGWRQRMRQDMRSVREASVIVARDRLRTSTAGTSLMRPAQ